MSGLIEVIEKSVDFKVSARYPLEAEELPWLTDLVLVDLGAGDVRLPVEFFSRAAGLAPVLLLAHRSLAAAMVDDLYGAGVTGMVDHRVGPRSLLEKMRAVVAGCPFFSPTFDLASETPMGRRSPDLSGREQQVVDMIARGLTHQQVARSLGISRHTVDTYVKRIRAKLNVGNKAELTRVAMLRTISA